MDLDRVTKSLPELSELEGKSVLVTESNGMICSAVINVLMMHNETHSVSINVIAAGRSEKRVRARFGRLCVNVERAGRDNVKQLCGN